MICFGGRFNTKHIAQELITQPCTLQLVPPTQFWPMQLSTNQCSLGSRSTHRISRVNPSYSSLLTQSRAALYSPSRDDPCTAVCHTSPRPHIVWLSHYLALLSHCLSSCRQRNSGPFYSHLTCALAAGGKSRDSVRTR